MGNKKPGCAYVLQCLLSSISKLQLLDNFYLTIGWQCHSRSNHFWMIDVPKLETQPFAGVIEKAVPSFLRKITQSRLWCPFCLVLAWFRYVRQIHSKRVHNQNISTSPLISSRPLSNCLVRWGFESISSFSATGVLPTTLTRCRTDNYWLEFHHWKWHCRHCTRVQAMLKNISFRHKFVIISGS